MLTSAAVTATSQVLEPLPPPPNVLHCIHIAHVTHAVLSFQLTKHCKPTGHYWTSCVYQRWLHFEHHAPLHRETFLPAKFTSNNKIIFSSKDSAWLLEQSFHSPQQEFYWTSQQRFLPAFPAEILQTSTSAVSTSPALKPFRSINSPVVVRWRLPKAGTLWRSRVRWRRKWSLRRRFALPAVCLISYFRSLACFPTAVKCARQAKTTDECGIGKMRNAKKKFNQLRKSRMQSDDRIADYEWVWSAIGVWRSQKLQHSGIPSNHHPVSIRWNGVPLSLVS